MTLTHIIKYYCNASYNQRRIHRGSWSTEHTYDGVNVWGSVGVGDTLKKSAELGMIRELVFNDNMIIKDKRFSFKLTEQGVDMLKFAEL